MDISSSLSKFFLKLIHPCIYRLEKYSMQTLQSYQSGHCRRYFNYLQHYMFHKSGKKRLRKVWQISICYQLKLLLLHTVRPSQTILL